MDNPELQELYDRAFGTLDVVEQQKLLKELSQKILAGNYYAIVPTGHVNLAHWPWVENYYGEDGESVGGLATQSIFSCLDQQRFKARIRGRVKGNIN